MDLRKISYKGILKLIAIPLSLMAVYLLVMILWRFFNLPQEEEFMTMARSGFDRYGMWVVFCSALVEGVLLLGQYFPGGTIIFLGVISSWPDPRKAAWVVAAVCLAFFISYAVNYAMGRYGWYRLFLKFGLKSSLDRAQAKMSRQGLNVIILSYWEPNLASISATAAGILKIPLLRFLCYSAAGIAIWETLWGILVFHLREAAMGFVGFKFVLLVFVVWVAAILVKHYLIDKKRETSVT